ncbi:hypothetical protein [Streptomyces albipurpureus]|uniref:Uncharacterized protein n=1 Tax=Streptomyces albipurpureus TaxID=2897419 RepID=A0ABT0UJT6_9ACTN|nr:hypothetical protein [Streptomyces sp. CWNU-1]MCM2388710.1 hypothetical protein [Streptomyces sp. CWNU-1]
MADFGNFAYWAEVIAEGPIAGSGEVARVVLGAFATPHVGRALRWLCVQAVRIANGLDPDPEVPWSGALICLEPVGGLELGDVSTQLRNWVADEDSRFAAYRQLRRGDPFTLTASDWAGRYALTVWPVIVPVSPFAGCDTSSPGVDLSDQPKRRAMFGFLR